jgi:hypothetical protein
MDPKKSPKTRTKGLPKSSMWMGWDGMGWDGMGWDGMGWDRSLNYKYMITRIIKSKFIYPQRPKFN